MSDKIIKRFIPIVLGTLSVLATAGVPLGGEDTPFDAIESIRVLQNKVGRMSHGYYALEAWNDVLAELDDVEVAANDREDVDAAVDIALLKARIYGDIRSDFNEAIEALETTRLKYAHVLSASPRQLYVREAEMYSRIGDELAIIRLIKEFKASPQYDPESYKITGDGRRSDPIQITRAQAGGDPSTTVTALEMYRQRAQFAPGNLFPNLEMTDTHGARFSLSEYRGKVVLVDFWLKDWAPWTRELAYLTDVYRNYRPQGFEIVGINMNNPNTDVAAYARKNDMTWRLVPHGARMGARFGIFGEARSFLIDQNGVIVARDLRGANLVEGVAGTLGLR